MASYESRHHEKSKQEIVGKSDHFGMPEVGRKVDLRLGDLCCGCAVHGEQGNESISNGLRSVFCMQVHLRKALDYMPLLSP